MSQIPRKTQLIFAGALTAANNVSVFGSPAANYPASPAWQTDLALIQSPAWLQGIDAALINTAGGNSSPFWQDFNAIWLTITQQLAYIFQAGIPEWDPNITYYPPTGFCQGPTGTPQAGIIYQANPSAPGANLNQPVTNTNYWTPLSTVLAGSINGQALAKAWAYFDGRTGTVYSSFNVSSVSLLSTGVFLLQFPAGLLADSNYAVLMSSSCDNTAPVDILTRVNGDTKTQTALMVRNLVTTSQNPWGGNVENYVAIYR